jgi:hypothetical protein
MNKQQILLLLVLSTISFTVQSQIDTGIVRLSGIVHGNTNAGDLPYVHIINKRTGIGTTTDSLGLFHSRIKRTDSLIFRCIGFEDKLLVLADTVLCHVLFIEVSMFEKSYELNVIDVIALSRESQFRYDFIHMRLDNSAWEKQLIIPGVTKEKYQWLENDEKFIPKKSFNGPLSALYYKFSDEGKSLQKLAELIEQDAREEKVAKKYNKQLLADFTGYSDTLVNAFYKFLDFSSEDILQSTPYEIYLNIQAKIPAFEAQFKLNDSLNMLNPSVF